MAVKRCPSCGDLYLAAVDRCVECDVVLDEVAEPDPEPAGDAGQEPVPAASSDEASHHTSWELHTWTGEGRRLLDGMLDNAGVARAWQGTTLVAASADREQVEEMVAVVAHGDARVGVDDATLAMADAPADGDDTVGYEVSGWDPGALDRLVARLERDGIAFGWDDDGDLVVNASDEARVDMVFADLEGDGDEDDEDEGDEVDGLVVQETLSDLFIAVDRLRKHPLDGASAQLLFDANDRAADLAVPFGFPPETWTTILERGEALAAHFEPGTLDDEAIQADAAALRALLRDFV
ncbi:MAG: hypothetical protein ACXIVQ_08200 [Acidimicrobiales bacterium]